MASYASVYAAGTATLSPHVQENDGSPYIVLDSAHESILLNEDPRRNRPRAITTMSLVALGFFLICGGPVGSEEVMSAGGPLVGLIALVVFPIGWMLPMNYIVTELTTALPEGGGHAYWIALAFGPFWGLQAGYWAWISTCIDCALYSSMAISAIADPINNSFVAFLSKATFAIALAIPGFFSIRFVGSLVTLLMAFVLVPYLVFSVWGACSSMADWQQLTLVRHENTTLPSGEWSIADSNTRLDIDWLKLFNTLVWNYSGFHNLSVFATDVTQPVQTYRKVMWIILILVPLTYLFPLVSGVIINRPPWIEWNEGSLTTVAHALGGGLLSGWTKGVGLLSGMGLYICALCSSSFLAAGMAENGLAPGSLGKRSPQHNTPQSAIFCTLAVVLVVVTLEFDDMMWLSNSLGAFVGIILILATIRLRFSMREMNRPTRLCGHAPIGLMVLVLLLPLATYVVVAIGAFQNLVGGVLTVVFLITGFIYAKQTDFSQFQKEA